MLIVSYDISDTKIRTRFSKFLKKYGRRLQYSVYEIKNSNRILKNIVAEIRKKFEKGFTKADSVFMLNINNKEILRFRYAKNEEENLMDIFK